MISATAYTEGTTTTCDCQSDNWSFVYSCDYIGDIGKYILSDKKTKKPEIAEKAELPQPKKLYGQTHRRPCIYRKACFHSSGYLPRRIRHIRKDR